MNLEVESRISQVKTTLAQWPTEDGTQVHEQVRADQMEQVISQLKGIYTSLKTELEKGR